MPFWISLPGARSPRPIGSLKAISFSPFQDNASHGDPVGRSRSSIFFHRDPELTGLVRIQG